jgi:hypothetical protein
MGKTRTNKNRKRNTTLAKKRHKLYSKRKGRGIGASKITARPYGRLLRMEAVKDDLDGWANVKAAVGNIVETPPYFDDMKRAPERLLEEQEQNDADRVVTREVAIAEMAMAKMEMAIAKMDMADMADSAEAIAEVEKAGAELEKARAELEKAHAKALLKWFAAQEEEEAKRDANPSNATFSLGRYVVIGG